MTGTTWTSLHLQFPTLSLSLSLFLSLFLSLSPSLSLSLSLSHTHIYTHTHIHTHTHTHIHTVWVYTKESPLKYMQGNGASHVIDTHSGIKVRTPCFDRICKKETYKSMLLTTKANQDLKTIKLVKVFKVLCLYIVVKVFKALCLYIVVKVFSSLQHQYILKANMQ